MGYLDELLSRNPLVIDGDTIRPHHKYTDDLYTGVKKQMNNYKNKIRFVKNLLLIEDSRDIEWS